ncbi:hypothetical protein D3C80_106160 [compost metagenome]
MNMSWFIGALLFVLIVSVLTGCDNSPSSTVRGTSDIYVYPQADGVMCYSRGHKTLSCVKVTP